MQLLEDNRQFSSDEIISGAGISFERAHFLNIDNLLKTLPLSSKDFQAMKRQRWL